MSVAAHFRSQATSCTTLGSPMYAELIARLADDIDAGGFTATVVQPWNAAPGPDAVALRLVGAIHRLVLLGEAPALAAYYPSVGGQWSLTDAWPVVQQVMREFRAEIAESMISPPQTNEVGRSAALMAGLLALRAQIDLPVRIFEIGASAGLNLLFDKFRYLDSAGHEYGMNNSEVLIDGAWTHTTLAHRTVEVVQRQGCDVAPVPLGTRAERARLVSYIWPDQAARLARVQGVLEVAAQSPPSVERRSAIDFVRDLEPVPDTLTVLWHSIMWQYVEAGEREQIRQVLAKLAERSSVRAPIVHLRLEPERRRPGAPHEFLLAQELSRGATSSSIVARCASHGPPVEWEESSP